MMTFSVASQTIEYAGYKLHFEVDPHDTSIVRLRVDGLAVLEFKRNGLLMQMEKVDGGQQSEERGPARWPDEQEPYGSRTEAEGGIG